MLVVNKAPMCLPPTHAHQAHIQAPLPNLQRQAQCECCARCGVLKSTLSKAHWCRPPHARNVDPPPLPVQQITPPSPKPVVLTQPPARDESSLMTIRLHYHRSRLYQHSKPAWIRPRSNMFRYFVPLQLTSRLDLAKLCPF